jgi:hypothetical protein
VDREQKAGRFPQTMWLGPNTVAYLESEIVAWVEARCAERAEVAADRAVKFSQRPKPKPRKFKTSNKTEDKQAEAAQ